MSVKKSIRSQEVVPNEVIVFLLFVNQSTLAETHKKNFCECLIFLLTIKLNEANLFFNKGRKWIISYFKIVKYGIMKKLKITFFLKLQSKILQLVALVEFSLLSLRYKCITIYS